MARIEAAVGLCALATRGNRPALDRVVELAGDSVPDVRFQIANRLGKLVTAFPAEAWEIAERLVLDASATVALAALDWLEHFRHQDRARALSLLKRRL